MQWKLLPHFLQMCSAITMSPIEGGHRTWEYIKYYTGAPFTNHTPQPWNPTVHPPQNIVVPQFELRPLGLSQAQYKSFFWQKAVSKGTVDHQVAGLLQNASLTLKRHQEVGCADTKQEFFRLAMEAIDIALSSKRNKRPLTITSFFRNWVTGISNINDCLKLFGPAILEIIKIKDPMKKLWDGLTENQQKQYTFETGGRPFHDFTSLCKFLVRN